jgi:hypothetical protein
MRHTSWWVVLLITVFILLLPSTSTADEWNRATTAIFNNPVQIPGQVLPAGIYVFKLAEISGERNVVQIWNADQTVLIASVIGWPDYVREAPAENRFVFEGREKGEPPLLKAWFYRGDTRAQTFTYQKPRPAK